MQRLLCLVVLIMGLYATAHSVEYVRYFTSQTLRLDYYHTGTASEEWIAVDSWRQESEWPGCRSSLIDSLNLGHYRLQVFDVASGTLIFSYGYSTIFNEWQTTPKARKGAVKTLHETVRFPFPKAPVRVVLSSRNERNEYQERFSTAIDPDSRFVHRDRPHYDFETRKILDNGPPKNKVDLVIIGDGYAKEDLEIFHRHARHYVEVLFDVSPFKERKDKFNVWVIDAVSHDSGIDEPRQERWRSTALDASYNSLDSPRYVLTLDNRALRDIAGLVPYDALYILVHSDRYGGGGIFNWYATSFTGTAPDQPEWWSDYVFVHEFGHSFAGLGDEYYTSDVAYVDFYPEGVEPWEPNVTALSDTLNVKWGDLIADGTPIPTPWHKSLYDSLGAARVNVSRGSAESRRIEDEMNAFLETAHQTAAVGCYEGSGYASTGLYRPFIDCRMFSKSLVDFCPVCQRAINRMIDFYSKE